MATKIIHNKEEMCKDWVYHKAEAEGNPRKGRLARRNTRLARRNVRGDVSVAQKLDSISPLTDCHTATSGSLTSMQCNQTLLEDNESL